MRSPSSKYLYGMTSTFGVSTNPKDAEAAVDAEMRAEARALRPRVVVGTVTRHLACASAITIRERDDVATPYCQTCERFLEVSELSDPGPFSVQR